MYIYMEFEGIFLSKLKTKKYRAEFVDEKTGKKKVVNFGQAGASDYTINKDLQRRNRYIKRHLKDLKTLDPTRAGYLSMFILWNMPDLTNSIKDYEKRYNKYLKTGKFNIKIKDY
jgi:hypothetical protein